MNVIYRILKLKIFCCLTFFLSIHAEAQRPKVHSHNDYQRKVPLWEAFASGCSSIEVDVIFTPEGLFVAHDEESIEGNRTLENLYLQPIQQGIKMGIISNPIPFFLMIDIKSEAYTTLAHVIDVMEGYQKMMYGSQNPHGLKLVISGNRPLPKDYTDYPEYVYFDHQEMDSVTEIPLEKVAMISLSFDDYSQWNGKGRLVADEFEQLTRIIGEIHEIDKPVRFWANPDSKTAWKAMSDIGVDYINTDKPLAANSYLVDLGQRMVGSSIRSEIEELSFASDGVQSRVDHVILLIGDGNGLAQISAGMYANGNALNMTNLRSVGLIKTQSEDDFTTDSAAGGTALGTGRKTHNRGVGIGSHGRPYQSLADHLSSIGFGAGVVTTDHVTGATPAAFYAHQMDRDMIGPISLDLSKSNLDLFVGAGKSDFIRYGNYALDSLTEAGFRIAGSLDLMAAHKKGKVGYFASHHGLPPIKKGREGFLREGISSALSFFQGQGGPFFLMVENGHIDNGGHANDARTVVEEVIDFDQAVAVALKFADQNPNTLVVITADHETGGLTIPQGNLKEAMVELEFSTEDHTGIMVPIFAYGPHSREFSGVYENTEVFHKIMEIISLYHQGED